MKRLPILSITDAPKLVSSACHEPEFRRDILEDGADKCANDEAHAARVKSNELKQLRSLKYRLCDVSL